ncbi:MAG: ATP-grasp protein [Thermoleophilia bacterium]|nr:ATP-grasp protein [Thermoleophilia bacterium]
MHLTLVTATASNDHDDDEAPLVAALTAAGVETRVCAWDDPAVDWGATPLTVIRSTWNYADHRDAFLAWARRASSASTVLRNPLNVIGANTHKSYLAALERDGIPVVPTRWFAKGGAPASEAQMAALPWNRVIVKPAVGGGSAGVRAFDLDDSTDIGAAATHVAFLQHRGEVLVQPELRSIVETGERDIVCIDGELTHTVIKRSRLAGDDEAILAAREPDADETALAQRVLRTQPSHQQRELLYARIDVAADELGTLRVVELELVEPSLFLVHWEPALRRFVDVLRRETAS